MDRIREAVTDALDRRANGADGTTAGTVADADTQTGSTGEGTGDDGDRPESKLFECPSCESVFVAVEKDTCATCRTAVDRIE